MSTFGCEKWAFCGPVCRIITDVTAFECYCDSEPATLLTVTLRSPAAKANRISVVSCCGSLCYMIFTHVAKDQAHLNCEWIRENKPVTLRWKKKRRTGWSRRRSCVYGPDGKIGRCSCFTKPRKCTRAPGPEVNLASSFSAVPHLTNT